MKLLHHLLVSAALMATTTTSVAAQELDVSDFGSGSSEDTTKFLRGSDPNYDDVELYTFPDEDEDAMALIPAAAVEVEIDLDDDGEGIEVEFVPVHEESDPAMVPTILIKIDDSELVLDDDGEDTVQEQIMPEDNEAEYDRHLRNLVDPAPAGQIQLAETTAPTEKVTPPSNLEKPNLRGGAH
ncbi:hypothetical protein PPTG_08364 [Phytophthora nicotianae INRA-310]|uniref:RxLR effector protein n=1 Tax=Phytophthora nicotianae (strain INRA-310) TaxID=761204 RepID=W2QMX7_PHYN3|nr:hypothetical protein PPTG_08364 [Phytophthora nicotianae INRA-310]ETN13605.1 hypothetical protein PPTG_08364 [Phytophthora nicotianae INRA-310]